MLRRLRALCRALWDWFNDHDPGDPTDLGTPAW